MKLIKILLVAVMASAERHARQVGAGIVIFIVFLLDAIFTVSIRFPG